MCKEKMNLLSPRVLTYRALMLLNSVTLKFIVASTIFIICVMSYARSILNVCFNVDKLFSDPHTKKERQQIK